MSLSKIECRECGAELAADARFCSRCGVKVEHPPAEQIGTEYRRCEICGHQNIPTAHFCEACGAEIPEIDSVAPAPATAKQPAPQKTGTRSGKLKLELWQKLAAAGVLALLGFFVYLEVTREHASPKAHFHQNVPAANQAALREIEELQSRVKANPSDAASWLRLGGLLQENSTGDARLLVRAIEAYKKYLEIHPSDPNARVDLGVTYYQYAQVDAERAGEYLHMSLHEMQRALRDDPENQAAAFNLGIVNLMSGNMQESTQWFQKTVELNAGSDLGKRAQRLLDQHSF
jgi:cytochrome c-type biogenesis protein CcmH/NrfG/ribosomal protein L40E